MAPTTPLDDTTDYDTIVVGAGLAGLVAACTAAGPTTDRAGAGTVLLVDAHPLGGRARCDERDGFILNRGPRALYPGGAAERVLGRLGAPVRTGGEPWTAGARGSFRGGLPLLPVGPGSALATGLLGMADKARFGTAFTRLGRLDPEAHRGRSVLDLLAHLHLEGVAADLAAALIRLGTYADAPAVLDAGAAVGQLQRARKGVRYLDGGWQSLVDALESRARGLGVTIRTGVDVRRVGCATGSGPPSVHTAEAVLRACTVIIATGGPDAATRLLGARPAGFDRLGPPSTVACLELGVRTIPRRRFVLGIDEPLYLSVHAPPAALAPAGGAVVHLLRNHRLGEDTDRDADRARLRALAHQAGITEDDIVTERFLARMTVTGAIPTAAAGGLPGRPSVALPDHPGILLAGDWVGGEGMLADAAVASGEQAGHLAFERSGTMASV